MTIYRRRQLFTFQPYKSVIQSIVSDVSPPLWHNSSPLALNRLPRTTYYFTVITGGRKLTTPLTITAVSRTHHHPHPTPIPEVWDVSTLTSATCRGVGQLSCDMHSASEFYHPCPATYGAHLFTWEWCTCYVLSSQRLHVHLLPPRPTHPHCLAPRSAHSTRLDSTRLNSTRLDSTRLDST